LVTQTVNNAYPGYASSPSVTNALKNGVLRSVLATEIADPDNNTLMGAGSGIKGFILKGLSWAPNFFGSTSSPPVIT
jgi:hypothetical protein